MPCSLIAKQVLQHLMHGVVQIFSSSTAPHGVAQIFSSSTASHDLAQIFSSSTASLGVVQIFISSIESHGAVQIFWQHTRHSATVQTSMGHPAPWAWWSSRDRALTGRRGSSLESVATPVTTQVVKKAQQLQQKNSTACTRLQSTQASPLESISE